MFERKRYQFGYVRQKSRKTGPHVWVWEYRDGSGSHSVILGTVDQMTEAEAWKATEGRRLILNDPQAAEQISFGAVARSLYLGGTARAKSHSVHLFELDQEPDPAQMGRLSHRARKAPLCRTVDQRVATFRQEQGARSRGDAHAFRLGHAMGIDPA